MLISGPTAERGGPPTLAENTLSAHSTHALLEMLISFAHYHIVCIWMFFKDMYVEQLRSSSRIKGPLKLFVFWIHYKIIYNPFVYCVE